MREVWRWGINPEEPAYKRTILLSLLGQEDPICAMLVSFVCRFVHATQAYKHTSMYAL